MFAVICINTGLLVRCVAKWNHVGAAFLARNITSPRRLPGDRPAISQTGTDSLHNNAVEVRCDSFRCHTGAASAPCHSPRCGGAVLHPNLRHARLRRALLHAGAVRHQAIGFQRKQRQRHDGRVRRLQLWPAHVRRLPRRPIPQ